MYTSNSHNFQVECLKEYCPSCDHIHMIVFQNFIILRLSSGQISTKLNASLYLSSHRSFQPPNTVALNTVGSQVIRLTFDLYEKTR